MTQEMQDALQRVGAAMADYVAVTKDEGDAETLSDVIVLFEAQGIDAESGSIYTRTFYAIATEGTRPSTALGILEIAGAKMREACL